MIFASVQGYPGIAWVVLGPETKPDKDTEWTGYEVETGRTKVVMVGDDRVFAFEPEEIRELDRAAFCGECGQIGCSCDGYDRTEEESK